MHRSEHIERDVVVVELHHDRRVERTNYMNEIYIFNDAAQVQIIQTTMLVGAGTGNMWNDCSQIQFLLEPKMPHTGLGFLAIQVG